MCSCSPYFSLPFISPWWPLAFLIFSLPLLNFQVFLPIILQSPLFFISRSCSFSVTHVNVDIQIESKERIGFAVVVNVFYL